MNYAFTLHGVLSTDTSSARSAITNVACVARALHIASCAACRAAILGASSVLITYVAGSTLALTCFEPFSYIRDT